VREVADEIAAVQRKIEDVEGQIKQLSDEITGVRRAKGDGWQDEMALLQQDKQQLVEEKRQLRDEKGRLQEEKLLLMRREE
jgi:chromosome segregation ATPase